MGVSTCTERTIILAHLFKLFANDGQQNGELHRSHARRFSELEPSSNDNPSTDEMHLRRLMSSVAEVEESESESMSDSLINEIADSALHSASAPRVKEELERSTVSAYAQLAGAAASVPGGSSSAASTALLHTAVPHGTVVEHAGSMLNQQSTRLRLECEAETTVRLIAGQVVQPGLERLLEPATLTDSYRQNAARLRLEYHTLTNTAYFVAEQIGQPGIEIMVPPEPAIQSVEDSIQLGWA
jgi:hypothetical protein